MENKLFKNMTSAVLVVVMVMSIFALPMVFDTDKAYASGGDKVRLINSVDDKMITPFVAANPAYNANASSNKHTFTSVVKPGKWNPIWADGHRYSNVVSRYQAYRSDRDVTKFVQGEEFFVPVTINVKGKNLNKTLTQTQPYTTSLYYTRYGAELYSSDSGKFTITTQFKKYYINIVNGTYSSSINFLPASSTLYTKKDVFYVQTKVKLSYDKKKGKLAKKKRTQWKNPTQKYGKLPKPKAKKGYKFLGWYTKKNGGKKIKSSTKVPSRNAVTLYARYKKK